MNRMHILLAASLPLLRQGIRSVLAVDAALQVAGEAGSAATMFQRLDEHRFDLILLEDSLPDRSGLDLLQEVRKQHSQMPVLMLLSQAADESALLAMRAGASGCVTRDVDGPELLAAVRSVANGRHYLSTELLCRLTDYLAGTAPRPLRERLSARELDVLKRIATGCANNQIAGELLLSPKTVSTYRTRILQKLGLRTSGDLIRYCATHRVVE